MGEEIPRLQRFYSGGKVTNWLHVPLELVNACIIMKPIIEAEESLQHIKNIAVGTGSLKKEDSKEIMSELERQANERTPPGGARQGLNIRRDKTALAAMGIQVVDVGTKVKKNGTKRS